MEYIPTAIAKAILRHQQGHPQDLDCNKVTQVVNTIACIASMVLYTHTLHIAPKHEHAMLSWHHGVGLKKKNCMSFGQPIGLITCASCGNIVKSS